LAFAPALVRLAPLEALQDLFYAFALDFEQYRYAQQLFGIGDLLEGQARQIADVYIQVAEGKLDPAELTQCLDKILSKSDRERLLNELLRKQEESSGKNGVS
jgi:hypothetical protein